MPNIPSLPRRMARALRGLFDRPELGFEERRKRKLFAVLIVPGIAILLSFGVHHLLRRDVLEGVLDLAAGIWLLLSLVAFRFLAKGLVVYRLNTSVLGLLFVFLAVKGGIHGNKLMWAFSFPLVAFYTLGKAEGLVWSAGVLVLIGGVLHAPMGLLAHHEYPPESRIRFLVAFFLVSILTYIYESVRERSQTGLERERNDLASEKAKLAALSLALQEANRALKVSEERLKRAQAIGKVGNLEYAVGSGTLWGSEQALRILGLDATGARFSRFVLRRLIPDLRAFRANLRELLRKNQDCALELTVNRLCDGKAIVLQAKVGLVVDAMGKAEKVVGVIQDVSERKQAEEERRGLEERLARSEKMEALGLLAGGVAHDLNNVLVGVVGYPDALLYELPSGSPLVEPLTTIRDSGQRAAAIVQDLLALARRAIARHQVLDLNDVVAEALASPEHAHLMSFHPRVAVSVRLDPALKHVSGSAVQLKKAIMNLVSNAAEALPGGGCVTLRTENRCCDGATRSTGELVEGEYVVLQVEDDGIGMPPEDTARIFEPFFTKKKLGRSGTGLGMAVVWGTVQDHRGHVQVESVEGHGTTIELYFPVTRQSPDQRQGPVPVDEYLGAGESILVVDDVLEQRELAGRILSKLRYSVQAVPSGERAVEFVRDHPVDLVVLDMIMDPGIDGLETYRRIARANPGQRALVVTGFSETERLHEAERLGVPNVMKPYTVEKLGLAVRQVLVARRAR